MAEITIHINNRPYQLACEDGQESHLSELALSIDKHARSLSTQVGHIAEGRLMLMSALMVADELDDMRKQLEQHKQNIETLRGSPPPAPSLVSGPMTSGRIDEDIEAVVADLLHQAATRLEEMAEQVSTGPE